MYTIENEPCGTAGADAFGVYRRLDVNRFHKYESRF